MGLQMKFYGGVIALGVLLYGYSMANKGMNYVETKAYITAVETDCYIEAGRSKIVEEGTKKTAYMDCKMAPMVAKQHDMDESAVRHRSRLKFSYRSPADGSVQTGEHTLRPAPEGKYTRDGQVMIYAHKEQATKYLWD
jgi:hypothetical protein